MPHVEHRLLVHRLVFEDGVDGLPLVEQRVSALLDGSVRQDVEDARVALIGEALDLVARGPFEASAIGGRLVLRIDATREELLEPFVDALAAEPLLHERVEAEGRQVTFVEDHWMPQGDGTGIVGLRTDEVEECTRSLPVATVPTCELFAIDAGGYCRHGYRRSELPQPSWQSRRPRL